MTDLYEKQIKNLQNLIQIQQVLIDDLIQRVNKLENKTYNDYYSEQHEKDMKSWRENINKRLKEEKIKYMSDQETEEYFDTLIQSACDS